MGKGGGWNDRKLWKHFTTMISSRFIATSHLPDSLVQKFWPFSSRRVERGERRKILLSHEILNISLSSGGERRSVTPLGSRGRSAFLSGSEWGETGVKCWLVGIHFLFLTNWKSSWFHFNACCFVDGMMWVKVDGWRSGAIEVHS